MEKEIIEIQVFGKTIKVACPANELDGLKAAAKDLDNRILDLKQKTKTLSSDQLIITVALNLSYELAKQRDAVINSDDEFTTRLRNLQNVLNDALNNNI